MIGSGKKERRDGDGVVTGDLTAFLDRGSRFEGKLHFEGHVRLNGDFKGDIRAEGTLIVGEGASIEAQITVDAIVISGHVTGDIVARNRVELHAPARVVGNITTPAFVVEEGAVFEGHCHMDGATAGRNGASAAVAGAAQRGSGGTAV